MKTTKIVTHCGTRYLVVSDTPALATKPVPVAKPTQTYSAPSAAKPSPFAAIRQLLGFKVTKQSGKARCVGCGDTVQLQAHTHQFYRGDQPLCSTCAGPDGARLAQLYATVANNPAQQYTAPLGSVIAVR